LKAELKTKTKLQLQSILDAGLPFLNYIYYNIGLVLTGNSTNRQRVRKWILMSTSTAVRKKKLFRCPNSIFIGKKNTTDVKDPNV